MNMEFQSKKLTGIFRLIYIFLFLFLLLMPLLMLFEKKWILSIFSNGKYFSNYNFHFNCFYFKIKN
jgi:hypothetical protein